MSYEGFDASAGKMKYSRNPPSHEYIGRLPTQEQAALVSKVQEGDMRAKERITEGLQRLVIRIAKTELRKKGRNPDGDLLEDMLDEGQIGLLNAINKYDTNKINPKTGKPFAITTYAGWWIRQAIKRALSNDYGAIVRIPIYEQEDIIKVRKAEKRLRALSGGVPTITDIAAEVGISERGAEKAYGLMNSDVSSLDYNYNCGEGSNMSLGDLLPDEKNSVESLYERTEISDAVQRALETALRKTSMKEEDVELLKQYFGFGGGDEQTLKKVADSLGVSRERVRQKVMCNLKKLSRNPEVRAILKGYAQY